jgi:hypothetical protein
MTVRMPRRLMALLLASAAIGPGACNRAPATTLARPATAFPLSETDMAAAASEHYGEAFAKPIAISSIPPPAIPSYDQPGSPGQGFLWTPGYWARLKGAFAWIRGAWVRPPRAGLLWTPGYWRWIDSVYGYIPGYWADKVGFYGGINNGHGYSGEGYTGARWHGESLVYNGAVTVVRGLPADAIYREEQPPNTNPVAFSGGPGGVQATPSLDNMAAARSPHEPPTRAQLLQLAAAMAPGRPARRAAGITPVGK